MLKRLALSFVVLLLAACSHRQGLTGEYVPYVASFLSDSTSVQYRILSKYDDDGTSGNIYILGAPDDVLPASEYFLQSDGRNNIDGRKLPDGLPDFSGETFSPVLDAANAPYSPYLSLGREDFLREVTARGVVSASDTSCRATSFDNVTMMHKSGAKAVLLASPYMSAYGASDADTILEVASSRLPVFSRTHAMVRAACSQPRPVCIAVWTTEELASGGIYASVLPKVFAESGIPSSSYHVFYIQSDGEDFMSNPSRRGLFEVLDLFAENSSGQRLDAVLADAQADAGVLKQALDEIRTSDSENLLIYKNLLSDSFKLVLPWEALADECYDYLRRKNRFTHNIAFPALKAYVTVPSAGLPDDSYDIDGWLSYAFKYSRIPGEQSPSWGVTALKDRYLRSSIQVDSLKTKYPKFYSLYVR